MGKTVALTATVFPSNATDKTVRFKSADETLARVDNNGVVTGVKSTEPGKPVVITVTTNDGNHSDTCVVTVRESLDKNLADPTVKFPINVNTYKVYQGDMLEPFKVGETYTVTIKGRKPAQKTFSAYNAGTVFLGNLAPVEGLSDVWSSTFKVPAINSSYPNRMQIYQLPNDNQYGDVQIDWLKIEKGSKITSNIHYSNAR